MIENYWKKLKYSTTEKRNLKMFVNQILVSCFQVTSLNSSQSIVINLEKNLN